MSGLETENERSGGLRSISADVLQNPAQLRARNALQSRAGRPPGIILLSSPAGSASNAGWTAVPTDRLTTIAALASISVRSRFGAAPNYRPAYRLRCSCPMCCGRSVRYGFRVASKRVSLWLGRRFA